MLIRTVIVASAFMLCVGGVHLCAWLYYRRPVRPARRADPLRIAELEYELFGIQPARGSAAEFAIGLRRVAVGADSPAVVVELPDAMSKRDAAEFASRFARSSVSPAPAVLVRGLDRWDVTADRP